MLKKTGLVVALMAATTVAASPLAFAGDKSHDAHRSDDKRHEVHYTDNRSSYERAEDNDTTEVSDSSIDREQYNRCYFEQSESAFVDSPLAGALPALGSQLQTLNCTNVGDQTLVDLDGEDADVVLDGTDGAAG